MNQIKTILEKIKREEELQAQSRILVEQYRVELENAKRLCYE